ncbi:MAG: CrcB family protein [Bdellovibrionales bacterium]|nr:CrcB family protein [Bdellovibrionales bacterium]
MDLKLILWVGVGGFLGTLGRFFVAQGVSQLFPMAGLSTLIVNVLGSLAIGFVYGAGRDLWDQQIVTILAVGVLGGFTTFSAFSAETVLLLKAEKWLAAALFIVVMLVLGLGATFVGFAAARWWR